MNTIHTFWIMIGTVLVGVALTCICVEFVQKPKYENDPVPTASPTAAPIMQPLYYGIETTESGTIQIPGDPYNRTWVLPFYMTELPDYIEDKEAFFAEYGTGKQPGMKKPIRDWQFVVFVMAVQLVGAVSFAHVPFILHKPGCTQNYVLWTMEEGRLLFDDERNLIGIMPPLREFKNYGVYCIPNLMHTLVQLAWTLTVERCLLSYSKQISAAEESKVEEAGITMFEVPEEGVRGRAGPSNEVPTDSMREDTLTNLEKSVQYADHIALLKNEEKEKQRKGGYQQWLKTDKNGHLVVFGYRPRVTLDISIDYNGM